LTWRLTKTAKPYRRYDFDMGSSVFGEQCRPRGDAGRSLYWAPDGRWLFDIVEKEGSTPIVRVDTQTRK